MIRVNAPRMQRLRALPRLIHTTLAVLAHKSRDTSSHILRIPARTAVPVIRGQRLFPRPGHGSAGVAHHRASAVAQLIAGRGLVQPHAAGWTRHVATSLPRFQRLLHRLLPMRFRNLTEPQRHSLCIANVTRPTVSALQRGITHAFTFFALQAKWCLALGALRDIRVVRTVVADTCARRAGSLHGWAPQGSQGALNLLRR